MDTACCNMHRAYPSRRSVAPEELDDDSGRKGLSSIGFCVKERHGLVGLLLCFFFFL